MRKIILHHHFFKNAGSTLIASLQRELGNGFIEYHPSKGDSGLFSEADLADLLNTSMQLSSVSSHHLNGQNYNQDPLLRKCYRFYDIILVRHPLKRLISMYDYYRTLEPSGHPIARAAQSVPVNEFFDFMVRKYPNQMISPQVNSLSGGAVMPASEKHLARAIERLTNCLVCGTVENYRDAMIVGEYFAMPIFPGLKLHYSVVNSSPRAAGYDGSFEALESLVGRKLYAELEQLNILDIELCNAVDAEVARRREHIIHYAEFSEDFSRRCVSLENLSQGRVDSGYETEK